MTLLALQELVAAGAVVLGKTVTTEFALFTPNKTTNPHNPDRTPGGSSSGSAAAVADNQVRAAFRHSDRRVGTSTGCLLRSCWIQADVSVSADGRSGDFVSLF